MLRNSHIRTWRVVFQQRQHQACHSTLTGALSLRLGLETEVGGAGSGWRALQLRFFAKRKGRPPHGPHLWLKMDSEKWHKDLTLDTVWEEERELIYLIAMKDILATQPGMQMSLKVLGSYKRYIGMTGKNSRPAAWLQRYPTLFKVETKVPSLKYLPWAADAFFGFTSQAAQHLAKEKQFWLDNETLLVDKVRKILMMTPHRRIPLEVFGHLRKDLGLPEDIRNNLVSKYPEYFRLVESPRGFDLELLEWNAELAVTSFQRTCMSSTGSTIGENSGDNTDEDGVNWSSFKQKGSLKKTHRNEIISFHRAPFVSPYQETPLDVKDNSMEAEKHAVAVLHELLSLTLRKRITVDRLSQFRTLWSYPKTTRSVLIQHPELFYVSLKNAGETAFLRAAHCDTKLIVKDPFLEAQSWVATLMEESKAIIRAEKEQAKLERAEAKLERENAKGSQGMSREGEQDVREVVYSGSDESDHEDFEDEMDKQA